MSEKISAALVKSLREQTGAGMMECKRALEEAKGDIKEASELIAKAGYRKAEKKADRTAAEGMVICQLSPDGKSGVLLEVNCETDFVARGDDFKSFCQLLSELALKLKASTVEALKALPYASAQGTVEEARLALVAKLGENLNIRRVQLMNSAQGHVGGYLHGSRIGVLVEMEGGDAQFVRDIAMHIAASRPHCVNPSDVPAEQIDAEMRILKARAEESGKPAAIIEKMLSGQLQKYLNEVTLLGQPFVKDLDQSVEKVLKAHQASVKAFCRFEVGEGIEVQKTNFEEEVKSVVRGS